jgi:hypothetical protein
MIPTCTFALVIPLASVWLNLSPNPYSLLYRTATDVVDEETAVDQVL